MWRVLILCIRTYQLVLRPILGRNCRFDPSCSTYAIAALQDHGTVRGTGLAAGRILRCHPWCAGGHDPVPLNGNDPVPPNGNDPVPFTGNDPVPFPGNDPVPFPGNDRLTRCRAR